MSPIGSRRTDGGAAELLETSTGSVGSALQRARAELAEASSAPPTPPSTADQRELLARVVDAFERYDMDALAALMHRDVIRTTPPFTMWLQGIDDLAAGYVGPGAGCEGSRLHAGEANGCPALARYRPDPVRLEG